MNGFRIDRKQRQGRTAVASPLLGLLSFVRGLTVDFCMMELRVGTGTATATVVRCTPAGPLFSCLLFLKQTLTTLPKKSTSLDANT